MSGLWLAEFWRIAFIAAAGGLLGLLIGHPRFLAAFAVVIYFVWHLIQLRKLVLWLDDERASSPPEGIGIWGEVFHLVNRLQQRNRKRERQLTGIVSQYRKATDAMPDATVVLGRNWEIQWFNEAASTLLDFKPNQDLGQRIDNLLRHPSFTGFLVRGASGVLEIPSPQNARMTISIRVVPYGDEQRLLIARDISEKQRVEQMRRDFVGNVSHELRTPLTVVAGFLETISDADDECTRSWQRPLGLMRQQTVRMQNLVDDLLLLSRLENDRYQPARERVDVSSMIAAIQEDARVLSAEKGHRIEAEVEQGLMLWGAERELFSAFNNLVTNAVRYTPAGGRIAIRWHADGGGAHFSVTDSGVGIAPQHLPRVTERFYRVDPGRSRESGGTGLGLAIVKHVLQRHDARLSIASELGVGSTFACDFAKERIVGNETPTVAGCESMDT